MLLHIILVCILLSNSTVYKAVAVINVIDKGIVPMETDSVALQFYIDLVNEDRYSSCKMHYWTEQCFLVDPDDHKEHFGDNCDNLLVYGGNKHVIRPRDRDTIYFVYPTLVQYDQSGSCNFVINYNYGKGRLFKREDVNIKFDTRLKHNKNVLHDIQKPKACDTSDLDSLNNCEPIDCNKKYMGTKPYFDCRGNKCVRAEVCEADPDADLPDLVYDPETNTCKDLKTPLSVSDIYAISSGLGVVNETANTSGSKVEVKSNCSTISHNLLMLRDMMTGKLYPMPDDITVDYSPSCQSAFFQITIFILSLCALLLTLILCVNFAVWTHRKWSNGDLKTCLGEIKEKYKKSKMAQCESKKSRVNKDVKDNLLKDVIVTNLPIELRDSVANMCEKVNREGKWKRRYRMVNIGSQINLVEQIYASSRTSSTTTLQEGNH